MDQPAPTDKEAVDRVIAEGVSAPARSQVYLWMKRNHARLAAQFEGVRVQWAGVAETLASLGIRDVNGNPPKAASVRRTWWRVRRDVAASKARTAARRADPATDSALAQTAAATPVVLKSAEPLQGYPPDVVPVNDEGLTRTKFRPSGGLKKWPSADPKALAVSAQPSMEPSRPAPAFDPMETADAPRPAPRFGVSRLRD